MNIVDIMRRERAAKLYRPALRLGRRSLTYGALLSHVDAAARDFAKLGFPVYARVGLWLPEDIDYIVMTLAVLSQGQVVVPVPQGASPHEVAAFCRQMELDGIVEDPRFSRATGLAFETQGLARSSPLKVRIGENQMAEQRDFESINPAFVRFTSGTTGTSKGVVISHEAIRDRTDAVDKRFTMTDHDVVLWVLPMSFHFVATILLFLRRGCEIVLCGNELPHDMIECLRSKTVTFLYALPLHYDLMVKIRDVTPAMLQRVRLAISTATSLTENTAQLFAGKFGLEIGSAYGLIEVGLPFMHHPVDSSRRGSVGTVSPDYSARLRHADEDGVGVVELKGPGMFDAYLRPWRRRDQITSEGWFDTGDLGRFDREGFLYLVGRKKEIINFMGMKIFPQEVEEVLNRYPAVIESRVYGSAHREFGELPCADVVFDSAAGVDIDGLRAFCYRHLAIYKVPKKFACVGVLARTASGKLLR